MTKSKKLLKEKYLLLRKNLSSYDVFIKSWFAQENFLKSIFFSKSKIIGVYYPVHNEVQTFRIICQSILHSKIVCIPKLVDEKILFYEFNLLDRFEFGRFGILEPLSDAKNLTNELDIVLAPGVTFDICGYRIGYGKGYYDKFFKVAHNDIIKIGLGYEFQLLCDCIEREPHDVKMDFLITNKEVISF